MYTKSVSVHDCTPLNWPHLLRRNLLTKNVDFGGAKATAAAKSPAVAQPSQQADKDPKWEEMRRARAAYEEKAARAAGGAEGESDGAASAAVTRGAGDGGAAKAGGGAEGGGGEASTGGARAPETGGLAQFL